MKSFVTLIICAVALCFPSFLSAQVSLNQSDMPAAGDLFRYSVSDTLPDLEDIVSTSGSGNTWDFSYFNPIAQQTDSFISINEVPITIRFSFPFTANLAVYIETPDSIGGFGLGSGYQIYEVKSNAFINYGFGSTLSGFPIALENDPADTVFTLPISLTDGDSSFSSATLAVPGLIYYSQDRKRVWEADADGQITTPFGQFASLRVHSIVSGRDSLAFDTIAVAFDAPVQEEYTWYSPDYAGRMLTISVAGQDSSIQFISNLTYADSLRDVFQIQLGLQNPEVTPVGLYPNPSTGLVNVDLPVANGKETIMSVFSVDGKLVWRGDLQLMNNRVSLPVLPSGLYQVVIKREDEIFQGKLMME